ncbi:MAG: shikimate dehydrogenase [Alphaproteobacteria bacterium]|nr:shikimate dehydrogenase [Alphaproteobacteria bacterium]
MTGGGPTISGTTRLIVAMGDPVAQVRFPEVFTRYCAERDIDAVSIPMRIPAAGLADAVRGFRVMQNLIGLSVTIPHKGPITKYLDRLSERARRTGVVNAVRREPDGTLVGDIFDGEGFVAGVKHRDINLRDAKVWLVGAGGAGTAIAFALFDAGIGHLTIRDTAEERATALARRLGEYWPGRVATGDLDLAKVDIAINATPAGLRPDDPLSFDPAALRADAVVADIIMRPPVTKLLAAAEKLGRRTHPGHHMLDHQVAIYAEFLRLGP